MWNIGDQTICTCLYTVYIIRMFNIGQSHSMWSKVKFTSRDTLLKNPCSRVYVMYKGLASISINSGIANLLKFIILANIKNVSGSRLLFSPCCPLSIRHISLGWMLFIVDTILVEGSLTFAYLLRIVTWSLCFLTDRC